MGLISTLKSILGVGGRADREDDTTVTVEHEPDASAERAAAESEPEPVASASEEVDEEAATEADSEDEAATEAVEGSDESVETISGIGPAYADRLADVGIETVGDLAAADAAEIAERTDLSANRVRDWIEQARGE